MRVGRRRARAGGGLTGGDEGRFGTRAQRRGRRECGDSPFRDWRGVSNGRRAREDGYGRRGRWPSRCPRGWRGGSRRISRGDPCGRQRPGAARGCLRRRGGASVRWAWVRGAEGRRREKRQNGAGRAPCWPRGDFKRLWEAGGRVPIARAFPARAFGSGPPDGAERIGIYVIVTPHFSCPPAPARFRQRGCAFRASAVFSGPLALPVSVVPSVNTPTWLLRVRF